MYRNKLTRRFLALSAALSLALCQSAFAGETVELNLDDAMQRAFQTNPTVSIAQYELDSARASYNAARQSRGVSITASHQSGRSGYGDDQYSKPGYGFDDAGNIQWFNSRNQGKDIKNSHSNTLTAKLPIFTGGNLSGQIKRAKANYQYNEVGVQRTYNEMRSTVTNGYFNMLQADNMQKLSAESVTRLEDHLKNVQAQYDVGVVAKVDVLRSQVELANAKQTLIQAENSYQVAEANMNKIVGLPMDTNLKLDNLLVYNAYDKNMDDCLAYAAEHRPELMQAKYNVDAAKGALMVARSGHMPQVAAQASQNWKSNSWPGDDNDNWAVGLSVEMNVFDTGVTLSKIHGAEADLKKAQETYRDTVDSVNLDVRSNYLGLREAEKRISTTKLAVEQADEDYRIAQLRYMSGVGTNTDVLDAQVALTQAKTNYTQALYDYNTSKTALETSIGVPMTNPVKVTVAKAEKKAAKTEAKAEKTAAKTEEAK
ncbi:TolC family protein [uncultured Phascolarctobacterium sp.]|uniref:TolC family protein n=1 Tax=uncultured Phascolarctobacterium sp. TaxID=512296 RepID=UPI0025DCE48D|nr:TolC family protein [uncultured Phascolarctobacterium sp.]